MKAARTNWLVNGNTARFGDEAYLLHNWSAKATFETIKSAYQTAGTGGRSCNLPPKIASLTPTKNGLTVTFSCAATDADGIADHLWDFGDGSKGSTKATTHTYGKAGTYLVGCYARDGRATPAANVKFEYITVTVTSSDGGVGIDAASDQGMLLDGGTPDTAGVLADTGGPGDAGATADNSGTADQDLRPPDGLRGGCAMAHRPCSTALQPIGLWAVLALLLVARRRL